MPKSSRLLPCMRLSRRSRSPWWRSCCWRGSASPLSNAVAFCVAAAAAVELEDRLFALVLLGKLLAQSPRQPRKVSFRQDVKLLLKLASRHRRAGEFSSCNRSISASRPAMADWWCCLRFLARLPYRGSMDSTETPGMAPPVPSFVRVRGCLEASARPSVALLRLGWLRPQSGQGQTSRGRRRPLTLRSVALNARALRRAD